MVNINSNLAENDFELLSVKIKSIVRWDRSLLVFYTFTFILYMNSTN